MGIFNDQMMSKLDKMNKASAERRKNKPQHAPKKRFNITLECNGHSKKDLISELENWIFMMEQGSTNVISGSGHFLLKEDKNAPDEDTYNVQLIAYVDELHEQEAKDAAAD